MNTRRDFLTTAATATATAAAALTPLAAAAQERRGERPHAGGAALPTNAPAHAGRYRPPHRLGLGGVAIGTGFAPLTGERSDAVMRAA